MILTKSLKTPGAFRTLDNTEKEDEMIINKVSCSSSVL